MRYRNLDAAHLHLVKRRIFAYSSRTIYIRIFLSRRAISKIKLNSRELNYNVDRVILFSCNNVKNLSQSSRKFARFLNKHPILREIDTLIRRFGNSNEFEGVHAFPLAHRVPLSTGNRSENNHSPTAQIVAAVGWSLRSLFAYANRQSTTFLRSSLSHRHSFQGEFTRFVFPPKEKYDLNTIINVNNVSY